MKGNDLAMETVVFLLDMLGWFGLVVFAISGAILAANLKMDIIGMIILGTSTAIGGGTIRDVILDRPVFWLSDLNQLRYSLLVSVVAGLLAQYCQHLFSHRRLLEWFDALGLAAFTVIGFLIAQDYGAPYLVCVVAGILTATGGGLVRDVIANQQPFITSSGLYASASAVGALSIVIMQNWTNLTSPSIIGTSFLITLCLRSGAIIWDWRPPFAPKIHR